MNWAKVKIPSFGLSDSMVRFKNGTLDDDWDVQKKIEKDDSKGKAKKKK